jgi:IclR family acetate operon transcriptional repressor
MLKESKKKPKRMAVKAAPSSSSDDGQYASRAVAKAFALLRILGESDERHSLSRLAEDVDLTKSSTFRLLQTLQTLGEIRQDEDGRYTLARENRSSRYAQIASVLIPIAREPMHELLMRFKETVNLAMLFPNHIEVISVMESPQIVRMANTVGRILSPHASSLGKAIAAHQPETIAQHLFISYGLPRFTPNTMTDEVLLAREFQQIRERGYSTEDEESVMDGCCFGVPIFLDSSAAVAAMSISMPKSRALPEEERKHLTTAVRQSAAGISRQLKQAMIRSR